ncbi:hypothetical protein [Burkholderia sp. LMU1-1-1.1]|uniref:hypothetical protein n=1 Tax=Burkholderia sp. LMU1-1-1.1 TaxID=3135266 RepID=UPI0034207629
MSENTKKNRGVLARERPSGRYISDYERGLASTLLDTYTAALSSPDRRYCPNPDDPEEEQVTLYADQVVDYLLADLARIRDHGTLHFSEIDTNAILIRAFVRERRAAGDTYEKAVEAGAQRYPMGERTIRRVVKAKS